MYDPAPSAPILCGLASSQRVGAQQQYQAQFRTSLSLFFSWNLRLLTEEVHIES